MNVPDPVLTLYLQDEDATIALGRLLVPVLSVGVPFLLYGDLGMGKSTLARAMIQGWVCDVTDVPSPTFMLMLPYANAQTELCWHVDLYRIEHAGELAELGLDEAIESARMIIEWPDRLGVLPAHYIACHFQVAPAMAGRMVTIDFSRAALNPDISVIHAISQRFPFHATP